jgi:hypothetical protein
MPMIEAAARNRARAPVIAPMFIVVFAPTIMALLAMLVSVLVDMPVLVGRTSGQGAAK